ncbi:Ger(x)C family spore germination protein [Desulfosporosinus sp. SB140]|uniref:Ger(x)C family spore germination protein n=1 Tax=Desulfosporosinus paludis TaxID=3115649 RepID=UPI00388EEAEB
MKLFVKIGLLAIVLQVLCIGCWDQRDSNNMAIITVLGFDRITDEDGTDKWQISAFLMPSGAGDGTVSGSGGGGGEKPAKEEIVWRGKGLTISEAIQDFTKRSPRDSFFADANSVIIGERAAKEDLLTIIDYLNRLREQRPGSFIMVTKGNASRLFEAEPEAEISVSRDLKELAQGTARSTGIAEGVKLMNFTTNLLSTDRDPVAPEVRLITPQEKRGEEPAGPPKALLVEGLGVFKDAKLVGWLNKEETMGYNLITEKITAGNVIIRVKRNDKWFGFLVQKSKPKIKTTLIDNKLNVNVTLEVKGSVAEDNGIDLSPGEIDQVEQAISEQIEQIVMNTIETVRGYESDCLGFSEDLHRYSPKDWKEIKSHWRETFVDANVDVQVKASIENTGRLGQRLELKK